MAIADLSKGSGPEVQSQRGRIDLRSVGFFYLGLTTALPIIDPPTKGISFTLLVALALAWKGWRVRPGMNGLNTYLLAAAAVVTIAALAATSAWSSGSIYLVMAFGVWVLFVVPGLAAQLRDEASRRPLVVGLCFGATMYGFVVANRLLSREPVLDRASPTAIEKTIVGVNRNALNMLAILLLPFLIDWVRSRPLSPFRWITLSAVSLPLFVGGGRSGLIAAGIVILLDALLRPGLGRRSRALTLSMVLVLGLFSVLHGSAGAAGVGANRLVAFVSGERTTSDEARELLVDKAWNVAKEHPLLGVGFGGFRGIDHPVVEESRKPRARHIAAQGVAHNTYLEALAELGFVGGTAFYVLLAVVFWSGLRRSRSREMRIRTAAFGGILVMIIFNSALAAMLYLPMALVLGAMLGIEDASLQDPAVRDGSRARTQM